MNIGTALFLFFIGVALASTEHNNELRAIAQIESASGKNLDHPTIEKGMHKGHKAAGHYGLMPLTVIDLVSKNESLKKRYKHLLDMTPKQITAAINKNPEMDKAIATFFWIKLRTKFGPRRAAYAWYHGPGKAKHVEQKHMEQTPYVVKFTKEMEKLKNETAIKRKGTIHVSTTR